MKLSILFCAAVLGIPQISYGRAILPSAVDCSHLGAYCDAILDTGETDRSNATIKDASKNTD